MPVIVYTRVSTEEQAEARNGLNAQMDACLAWVERSGETVKATFTDEGISGGAELEKRPGLSAALAALKKGEVLLVAKLDRLSRNKHTTAFAEYRAEKIGARIVSASGEGTEGDNPGDFLMRGMVQVFAEYERRIIKQRTKSALQAKILRNERAGHIPFGQRLAADGKHLEPDPAEQAVIGEIARLRREGFTLRHIAADLNARGIFNRGGRKWSHVTVMNASRKAA